MFLLEVRLKVETFLIKRLGERLSLMVHEKNILFRDLEKLLLLDY